MDKWVPLLQSLIWPVFFAILVLAFRNWFRELLDEIKRRIESGSRVSVGPGGFTLGEAPKLEEQEEPRKPPEQVILDFAEETKKMPLEEKAAFELSKYFQLVHSATYNPEYSRRMGRPYYTINVKLEAKDPALLDRVSKVVYHLHPTFPNPHREIISRENNFQLSTIAWGQFNLSADVYFESGEEPLKLFRYLNF